MITPLVTWRVSKTSEQLGDGGLDEGMKNLSQELQNTNLEPQDPSATFSKEMEAVLFHSGTSTPSRSPVSFIRPTVEEDSSDEDEDSYGRDPFDNPVDDTSPFGETVPLQESRIGAEATVGNTNSISTDVNGDEPDGIYLVPDVYANSRSYMNPDGSLRFPSDRQGEQDRSEFLESLLSPPDISPEINSRVNMGARKAQSPETIEDLILALQETQNQDASQLAERAEKLHQEVFENEQAYLKQSELFRKSLTNRTAALHATELRRSANYRRDQAIALRKLDNQMKEMEDVLKQLAARQQAAKEKLLSRSQDMREKSPGSGKLPRRICDKCACQLKVDELEYSTVTYKRLCASCYKVAAAEGLLSLDFGDENTDDDEVGNGELEPNEARSGFALDIGVVVGEVNSDVLGESTSEGENEDSHGSESEDIGDWVKLDDLSTGEHFFWNERTGEMRREM